MSGNFKDATLEAAERTTQVEKRTDSGSEREEAAELMSNFDIFSLVKSLVLETLSNLFSWSSIKFISFSSLLLRLYL